MSVQLIVNGMFRSGTTLLWRILKENNHLVFYEPCHEELLDKVNEYRNQPTEDELHGVRLWDEYLEHEEILPAIRKYHPNLSKNSVFPDNCDKVVEYIKVFDGLEKETILQTNRWSFCLGRIGENFDVKLINLIRNPFDTFNSMQRVYFSQGSPLKQSIKKAFSGHFETKAFYQKQITDYAFTKFGLTQKEGSDPLETFIVAWVLLNHEAYGAIEKCGGLNIFYEDIIANPEKNREAVENYTGLEFPYEKFISDDRRKASISKDEREKLSLIASKWGIDEKADKLVAAMVGKE